MGATHARQQLEALQAELTAFAQMPGGEEESGKRSKRKEQPVVRATCVHQRHPARFQDEKGNFNSPYNRDRSLSLSPRMQQHSARTAKKGVETLQDYSYLFQKRHCEHRRNGFLQVRMAGMQKSNKKKVLKKKDGERDLHFPSCTPDVQVALRETRRTEWNKCVKFNAGVMLPNEEVRQLTEAGCRDLSDEMGRYRQKKRIYDEIMITFLFPAKYKSRVVGCGNLETMEGLRTDSPDGDVDSHTIVCSWCAQAHVSIHSCDFTNGCFQGHELIESCCIVFQPKVFQKKELQAERF